MTEPAPVQGSFRLRATGSQGGFDAFAVEDLHWRVPDRDPELRIDGSGRYTIGSPDATALRKHRLELDLRTSGSQTEHYDSGWVDGPDLPQIQIPISIHGMTCLDRVIVVDAEPVPESEIRPYTLVEGSTFQRGCFDPCDCPIGPAQPLTGTFRLLPLAGNALFADYGMIDAHWQVHGSSYATPTDAIVTGRGSYRVGGEFAALQRMEAELQVGDEAAASFDSGTVVGGNGFPGEIDVEISGQGKVCFDTVMQLRAKPQSLPEPGSTLALVAGLGSLIGMRSRRTRR